MKPTLPRGWFNWTIWQYSDKGEVNGINAKVDMNIFNGTLEDLYKFAGANIVVRSPRHIQWLLAISLRSIANKYGVTVRELVTANPQLLKTGDKLTVPVAVAIPQESGSGSTPREAGQPSTRTRTYTVKAGDTLVGHRSQIRDDGRGDRFCE